MGLLTWNTLSDSYSSSWTPITVSCLGLAYLLLVRLLRYRQVHKVEREYGYTGEASLSSMTADQAWAIQKSFQSRDFPFMTQKALQFALFKTYGIPTISGLLYRTTEYSKKVTAGKRAVDTEVLIVEFTRAAPTSERACSAIARMNYIHSKYQKAGKISNDDLLYTLALFALEPKRWIERFEWRSLTTLETCAVGTFWKSIGDAMGISFACLPSHPNFTNGTHWLTEVAEWAENYEARIMVYAESNQKVADETTKILAYGMPESWLPFTRRVVATLMSERLRRAMGYETSPWLQAIVVSALKLRGLVMKYLALPRFTPYSSITAEADPKTGKYYRTVFDGEPWYVSDSLRYSWSLQSLFRRVVGTGVPGRKFQSDGYKIEEVGPMAMRGKGLEEYEKAKTELMGSGRGGCPFAKM